MAVYTEVTDEDLTKFCQDLGLGEVLSCKGIAEGVENSNFLLVTQQDNYILTLYEKRVNPDDLPFFLGLLEHLETAGLACPKPVRSPKGEVLHTLSGRPAAVVTFLSGMWPRNIHTYHTSELGSAMAQMHVAGEGFELSRPNSLSVNDWRKVLDSCEGRGDSVVSGITQELTAELDYLEAHWPKNLPTGIIHADLFPDNVFFRGEKLSGLIDFYFACNDILAYDLAICLNAWCFEPDGSFNVTKAKKMLRAYGKVRTLSTEEIQALPLLARGAAIRFLLTRLYDWLNTPEGAMVTPHDPRKFLQKLRFHQAVKSPADYGLDPKT
ncbi:MAG: homoserine kinase [Rhodospirillaceae bacterium]|nr:MAG: homoserine kinase [Rhodospirillaceae bacterium]